MTDQSSGPAAQPTPAPNVRPRTAVITGAASGMGAAIGRRLAADGARVALLARRADRLKALTEELGEGALAVPVDVTDQDAVDAARATVHHTFGPVDLVVNGAGVMLPNPIADGRLDEWQHMIDLNLTGALRVVRAFGPDLVAAATAGNVADLVNISSIGAHAVFPQYAVYSATKAALTHLSAGLRAEFGPRNVRVTNVEPGLTGTELGSHIDNATLVDQLGQMFTAIEALTADDVADLVGYVTSRPRRVNLRQVIVLPTTQP
jgi:NADP-dependent 3-hydroxy acid dehydrogenase YdfG